MSFELHPLDSPSSVHVEAQPDPQLTDVDVHGGEGVSRSSWARTAGVSAVLGELVLSSAIAGCTTLVDAVAVLLAVFWSLAAATFTVFSRVDGAPARTSALTSMVAVVLAARTAPYTQVSSLALIVHVDPAGGVPTHWADVRTVPAGRVSVTVTLTAPPPGEAPFLTAMVYASLVPGVIGSGLSTLVTDRSAGRKALVGAELKLIRPQPSVTVIFTLQ